MPPHHSHSIGRRSHFRGGNRVIYYDTPEVVCYCDGVPCLCPRDTGELERSNPIPAGIYSVDLPNAKVPIFRDWQQGRSSVKVLKTNDNGEFSWILFSVSVPTIWATGIGFPDHAKATDERPQAFTPTTDPLDKLANSINEFSAPIVSGMTVIGVVGAGLLLYLNRKELFENVSTRVRNYRASRSR